MSRVSKITDDEKTLLNCSDEDIAVVTNNDNETDESLSIAMRRKKPVIAIKDENLARDISFWLKIGQYYRQGCIISATSAGVCSVLGVVRLSKILAISSTVLGVIYCAAWHWDPIFNNYHLLENKRLLTYLGSRYRRGTNVVLVRNTRRTSFWIPVMAPITALCISYVNRTVLL